SFALTALIEALGRVGVSVSATATGPNPVSKLPANSSYKGDPRVAVYVSPPFSQYTRMIFKISSNVGADLMLCLMAAKAGSTNCEDGFPVLAERRRDIRGHARIALIGAGGGKLADRVGASRNGAHGYSDTAQGFNERGAR